MADQNLPNTIPLGADSAAAVGLWADFAGQLALCGRQLSQAILTRAAQQGLAEKGFWLLWACRQSHGEVSQSELARRIGASPACVSGLVERLATAALIASSRPRRDRRQQLWSLTAEGEHLVQRLTESLAPWARDMNARFGPHRLAAIEHLLDQLQEALAGDEQHAASLPASQLLDPTRGEAA